MKISVIMPALNEEISVCSSLAALKKQDYKDFEMIVVDNGSTDKTADVARSFGAIVLREERRGTMWACEAGRKIAKGDIIVRMDADCIPEAGWLSRGAKYFKDERVVCVSGPYEYYDYSGLFRIVTNLIQGIPYKIASLTLDHFNKGAVVLGGNSFMRASALEKIGGFDTNIIFYGDDADIGRKMSKVGKCVYDLNLIVKSSARRFKATGIFKLASYYFLSFWKK